MVKQIKKNVVNDSGCREFKSIECQIMDIADDIAYSTYDLEDAFKGGFLTPLDLVAAKNELLERVCEEINLRSTKKINVDELRSTLLGIFGQLSGPDLSMLNSTCAKDGQITQWDYINALAMSYQTANDVAEVGYLRTELTSFLVNEFVEGICFEPNKKCPPLSKVYLDEVTKIKVEVLKRFTYVSLIISPRLAAAKIRGQEIVKEIFNRLSDSDHDGHHLLPDDFRIWYERLKTKSDRYRLICDFIAGMTDSYAVEFYFRLKAENPATIFKPL